MARLQLCLLCLLCSFATQTIFFQTNTAAQEYVNIQGKVTNGTHGAHTPKDLQVRLHVLSETEQVDVQETNVPFDGSFNFVGIPVEPGLVYILVVDYKGVVYSYQSDEQVPNNPVNLIIFEPDSSADNLLVSDSLLLVTGIDGHTRTAQIFERITLVNNSDKTYVPDFEQPQKMNFLRFSLPQDTEDLQVRSELPEGEIIRVDKGFAITSPVPPGEFDVSFTYSASYSGSQINFTRTFTLSTEIFRLMMPVELGKLRTNGIDTGNTLVVAGRSYHILEESKVDNGAHILVVMSQLDEPPFINRIWASTLSGISSPTLLASIASLALIMILVWGLLGRNTANLGPSIEELQGLKASLLQSIAHLDNQYGKQELSEAHYRTQRDKLKSRLLDIVRLGEAKPLDNI